MFNNRKNFNLWKEISNDFEKGSRDLLPIRLEQHMPEFIKSGDDLRLLFYIGLRGNLDDYIIALKYFMPWKNNLDSERIQRCDAYFQAVTYSLPNNLQDKKKYMTQLFLEATGYAPTPDKK